VGRAPLDGTLAARFSIRGTASAPRGALELEARGASGPRFPPTDLRADVALTERELRFAARVWRADGGSSRVLAWTSGVAKIPHARWGDLDAIERAPLDVRVGVGPVEARRRGGTGVAEVRARVRAEGEIGGTARAPVVSIRASADPVSLGGAPLGSARATLDYRERRARLEATLGSASGGALRVAAVAEADLGAAALARGLDPRRWPIDASLHADALDLRWLSTLTPEIRSAAGALTASARARGTAGAPKLEGRLEWTHGALKLAGLGAYENIHLGAHADSGAVTLDELVIHSSGGSARLAGAVALVGARALHLSADLERFPVYAQGRSLGRLSVRVSADGALGERALEARAKIPEAHVELTELQTRKVQSLARPKDVVLLENGRPVEKTPPARAAAPSTQPFVTRLVLDAPRNLWVRGKDANLELGLSPGFRVELGAETKVYGEVFVRRGRVDVVGRRFDLQASSRVEFTGPVDTPVLDVTAKHVNNSTNVTVLVTLKGPADAPVINVSAPDRPDLTETQLYTLIVSGRLDLGRGESQGTLGSGAASLVGSALAGALQKVIAPALPLDVFTVETGDSLTGARVEAGKNLGSRLYLGYVGRTGANPALLQNRNAVRLEYQFTARWSLDAEYGDVGTGTADLFWTKRY
jgi:translocation and assembly module TamB